MLNRKRILVAGILAGLCLAATGAQAGPKESLPFSLVMTGDLSGYDSRTENIRGNHSPVWFGGDFTLSAFFVGNHYGGKDGEECFDGGTFTGPIQITQQKDGSAQAMWFFHGFSDDGNKTDIKYVLTLVDPSGWIGGSFPPRDNSVTMIATEWEIHTEGKGQLRKVSCTGTGGLADGNPVDVTITVSQP